MSKSAPNVRLYDAAKVTDFHRAPDLTSSADYVVNRAGTRLRDYARWLDENNDITIGILDVLVNNIVGTGIGIEPQVANRKGDPLEKVNQRIRYLFGEWCRKPEITGELSMGELQRLSCRTWLRDGEMFAEHIQGDVRANRRRTIPYCVRVLEADWLPFEKNSSKPRIIHGIQKDDDGVPVIYHFLEAIDDPVYAKYATDLKTRPVPAERVEHLKFSRRLNQTRGVSLLHGVINRLDNIKDIEESEQIACRVAAAFTAAIVRNPDMIQSSDPSFLTEDGDVNEKYRDRYFEMSPGLMIDTLLPGEDIKGIGLDRPNNNLIEFLGDQHRRLASGTGTSYSSISKRHDGSYSSQRQELVEQKPNNDRYRSQFISDFLQPIYERFLFWCVESGQLTLPRNASPDTLTRADYRSPGMPWIDPLKEMSADEKAVQNGFKSRHMVMRERGYDPDIVDQQLQADMFQKAEQQNPPTPRASAQAQPEEDMNDED
jgi:lambda family phage portal protein